MLPAGCLWRTDAGGLGSAADVTAIDRPRLRLQGGFQVERVSRLSVAVAGNAVQGAGQLQQFCLSFEGAVVTPCGDDQCGRAAGLTDDVIIAWTVGVGCQQQFAGMGAAEGPRIEHDQAVEAPAAGEGRAAADCGIIEGGIGGGGIQSDKHDVGRGPPRASQSIAILSAAGKQGCAHDRAVAKCLSSTASSAAGSSGH